jgi:hypothetical protein
VQNIPQDYLKVEANYSAKNIEIEEIHEENQKNNIPRRDKNFR